MTERDSYDERLLTGYTGRVMLTVSAGYMAIQIGRNVLPPLLPSIMAGLDITPFQAGIALTLLSAMYALGMFPGGRLSDQLSRKTVLVSAATVSSLGFVLVLISRFYLSFLAGVAVIGFGAGLYWIAVRALLADLFVERRGQAFGLQDALGFVGPLIAAGGAVLVLRFATWNATFLPLVAVTAAIGTLAHLWVRQPYVLQSIEFDFLTTVYRVFRDREVRWLVVAYSCVTFPMQGVKGFLPVFLLAKQSFSPTTASIGFGLLFVGAMVTMPVAGALGDRFSYVPVAVGGIAVSVIGLVGMIVVPSPALTGCSILLFAIGIWAFPPVIQSYLMNLFPDASMGGDFGVFKMIYAIVGSLGPAYVGFVASGLGYAAAFAGFIVCLSVAILIIVWRSRQGTV